MQLENLAGNLGCELPTLFLLQFPQQPITIPPLCTPTLVFWELALTPELPPQQLERLLQWELLLQQETQVPLQLKGLTQ